MHASPHLLVNDSRADFYLASIGRRISSRPADESCSSRRRQIVGEVDYNIIKFAMDGRKISFLKYKDFDEEAHPELLHSVRVHLPSASYAIRDYSSSENPPILHRKEAFVDPLYPDYGAFSELTRQEEDLGFLSRPEIGFRQQWQRLLAEHHLKVVGHTICRTTVSE